MTRKNQSSFTEDELISFFRRLAPLHVRLLAHELDSLERQRLGGQMLPLGPGLVLVLGQSLGERADLFPDFPYSGAALLGEQHTAFAWLVLRNRLQALAQLAGDGYLAAQARLNGLALGFVNGALKQAAPPSVPEAEVPARTLALLPAFLMLRAYFKVQQKNKARNRARSAAPAPAPQAPQPKSPSRRRADAERRAHERRVLFKDLEDHLRSR